MTRESAKEVSERGDDGPTRSRATAGAAPSLASCVGVEKKKTTNRTGIDEVVERKTNSKRVASYLSAPAQRFDLFELLHGPPSEKLVGVATAPRLPARTSTATTGLLSRLSSLTFGHDGDSEGFCFRFQSEIGKVVEKFAFFTIAIEEGEIHLDVKPEQDHVALLDDVVLSLAPQEALLLGGRLGPRLDEIIVRNGLRSNESLGEV